METLETKLDLITRMEILQTEEVSIQEGDKIQVEDNGIIIGITGMEIRVEAILLVLLEIFLVDFLVVLMDLEEEEADEVLFVRFVSSTIILQLIAKTYLTEILFLIFLCKETFQIRIKLPELLSWLHQKELLTKDGIWIVEQHIISQTIWRT